MFADCEEPDPSALALSHRNLLRRYRQAQIAWQVGALFVLTAVCLLGLLTLKRHGPAWRVERVSSLDGMTPRPLETPAVFRAELAEARRHSSPTRRALAALHWTVNQVRKVEASPTQEPAALLRYVTAGGGTLCGGMAALYHAALAATGTPSRIVLLQRNIFDAEDGHVTVEARLEGRWVIIDPTFNVSFAGPEGRLLSAEAIHWLIQSGRAATIRPLAHRPGAYPARLGSYYMHYLPLYNNLFIFDPGRGGALSSLPPFRYWLGPRLYYQRIGAESTSHLELAGRCYFIFVVLLPLAAAAALLGTVLVGLRWLISDRWRSMAEVKHRGLPTYSQEQVCEPGATSRFASRWPLARGAASRRPGLSLRQSRRHRCESPQAGESA